MWKTGVGISCELWGNPDAWSKPGHHKMFTLLIRNPCRGRKLPHPRLLLPLKDYANTSLVSAGGSCVQQIHNNYSFLFLVSFKKKLLNSTETLKTHLSLGGLTSCLIDILRNFVILEWEEKKEFIVMEGEKLEHSVSWGESHHPQIYHFLMKKSTYSFYFKFIKEKKKRQKLYITFS